MRHAIGVLIAVFLLVLIGTTMALADRWLPYALIAAGIYASVMLLKGLAASADRYRPSR